MTCDICKKPLTPGHAVRVFRSVWDPTGPTLTVCRVWGREDGGVWVCGTERNACLKAASRGQDRQGELSWKAI